MTPVGRVDASKSILDKMVKRMAKGDIDPLTPLIDRYYVERKRSASRVRPIKIDVRSRPRPGGRLSPSQVGGCQRAAVFNFVDMPGVKRIDPETEAIFEDGNWRHHKWQTLFKDMQKVLGRETFKCLSIEEGVIFPELYIAGSLDVRVWIKGFGYLIIDIKGINDAGFTRVANAGEPLDKHIDQVVAYCKARSVRRALLLYENKNDNRWKCFVVQVDEARWEHVEYWATQVIKSLQNAELPDKDVECDSGTYLYDRCPYANWCYGSRERDEVERVAFKDFKGIEAAWDEGNRIAAEG